MNIIDRFKAWAAARKKSASGEEMSLTQLLDFLGTRAQRLPDCGDLGSGI